MNLESIDWESLERMRAAFLSGTAGAQDYWHNDSELAAYDATFAQRIGWKWDYVLEELKARGWSPPAGDILDWGCGSGVAGRAFLNHFGMNEVSALRLLDRSTLARAFAAKRAREKFPGLKVVEETQRADSEISTPPGILLISHVLTEMTQEQTAALVSAATSAECVIWIEPGTYETSLTLIAIRERLRTIFNIIAPCTHQERCGILSPENERHWCHHFASPPQEVFMDGDWAKFGNMLGIDLRDLPLSFLVLDRRTAPAVSPCAGRVIGHARLYKAHALLLGCDASGVSDRRLMKRLHANEFRALKKDISPALREWECREGEIVRTKPLVANERLD
jgi:SAM-dependent methyltransferase